MDSRGGTMNSPAHTGVLGYEPPQRRQGDAPKNTITGEKTPPDERQSF